MVKFIRDNRSPIPTSEIVSRVMSKNSARDTQPEIMLRKHLWKNGFRGYRLHWSKVPGKPDICFPGRKIAIFVNGCYWHRCPKCNLSLPKSNFDFWKSKFEKNIKRDRVIKEQLIELGWTHIVIWECEIKNNVNNCVGSIAENVINR